MNQSTKCDASAKTEGAMLVLQSKSHDMMPHSTPPSQIRGLPVSLRNKPPLRASRNLFQNDLLEVFYGSKIASGVCFRIASL